MHNSRRRGSSGFAGYATGFRTEAPEDASKVDATLSAIRMNAVSLNLCSRFFEGYTHGPLFENKFTSWVPGGFFSFGLGLIHVS